MYIIWISNLDFKFLLDSRVGIWPEVALRHYLLESPHSCDNVSSCLIKRKLFDFSMVHKSMPNGNILSFLCKMPLTVISDPKLG